MKAVEITNLTKFYKKNRGIENISFAIDEGEIFGFIGPNGAGKSTTIRTLLNFIHPTSGNATIFGKNSVALLRKKLNSLSGTYHQRFIIMTI